MKNIIGYAVNPNIIPEKSVDENNIKPKDSDRRQELPKEEKLSGKEDCYMINPWHIVLTLTPITVGATADLVFKTSPYGKITGGICSAAVAALLIHKYNKK